MGNYLDALELYKTVEDTEAEHVWPDIADCYHFLGEHLEALRFSAKLAIRSPNTERWWNNLSLAAMQLNKLSVAILHDMFFTLPAPHELEDEMWQDLKIQTLIDTLLTEFGEDFIASILN